MSHLLIIGCVSFDTVHLERSGERKTHTTIGGAALYTALAAAKAGAEVTLLAPRPDELPDHLKPAAAMVNWVGPRVALADMPTLEIVHHLDDGDRATLLGASWGAENLLVPALLNDIQYIDTHFDIAHIAALSSAARQLDFMHYFKKSKPNQVISAGTYARAIQADAKGVKELLQGSDAFFMNSNEARLLFNDNAIVPSEYQVIFVTDGKNGVDLYQSMPDVSVTHFDCEQVEVADPTGAGDSFCGAALAGLTLYVSPGAAAQVGVLVASKSIEYEGPSIYFVED
jgi:ribokinase